ncbi:MAG: hypothetical protein JSV19_06290, partial [Phycisphaerales bacterium]
FALVREEARRRGLRADSSEALAPPTFTAARRVFSVLAGWVHRACRIIWAHSLLSGVGLGIFWALHVLFCRKLILWIPFWLFVSYGLYLACLVLICWPLRDHRVAVRVPLAAWASQFAVFLAYWFVLLQTVPQAYSLTPPGFLRSIAYNLLIYFGGPLVLLSAAVHVRNRYWPVHEPGRCRVCDYDLRGLPEPRCPECGSPFDPADVAQPAR